MSARRLRRALVALSLVMAGPVMIPGEIAADVSTPPGSADPAGTHVRARQTWYAYVAAGERLDVSFTKAVNAVGSPSLDFTFAVRGPGGVTARCGVADEAPVRSRCRWAGLSAEVAGVWSVELAVEDARCPVVGRCAGRDGFSWTIGVRRGSATVPGRVWTERYEMSQHPDAPPVDLSLWYQSELGYTYLATHRGHHGVDSAFAADNVGVVRDFTCVPAYESSDHLPAADGWCGGVFKVFFEPPAADLPAEAAQWDGGTRWVLPPVGPLPVVTGGTFTPSPGSRRTGTLTFEVAHHSGPLVVRVDGNGDGDHLDVVDRLIPVTAGQGIVELFFDGLGGDGLPVPLSGPISFEVLIERTAEVHFLSTDVELRGGGIEVTRLNGPRGGERTLHWNDIAFVRPGANRCSVTPVADGRSGVDSAGGVHGWDIGTCGSVEDADADDHVHGGWGDTRVIDDWAFLPVGVTHTVRVP